MKAARLLLFALSAALTLVLLVLSITPYFARSATFDYLSGYRFLYLLLALLLSLTFAVLCFRWRNRFTITPLLCAALSLILNWLEIRDFFYGPPQSPELSATPTTLRLISFNLNQGNDQHEKVLASIRSESADLVILMEADEAWGTALQPLSKEYPFHLSYPRIAMEIFSRTKLTARDIRLVGEKRGDVLLSLDGKLNLYACHAYPWTAYGREGFNWRNQHLRELGADASKTPSPLVVIGDFNASPWSRAFEEMLVQSKLRDARLGFGPLRTQSNFGLHFLLGLPLDHCLVSEDVEVRLLRTGPPLGSDHLPLIVDIAF